MGGGGGGGGTGGGGGGGTVWGLLMGSPGWEYDLRNHNQGWILGV